MLGLVPIFLISSELISLKFRYWSLYLMCIDPSNLFSTTTLALANEILYLSGSIWNTRFLKEIVLSAITVLCSFIENTDSRFISLGTTLQAGSGFSGSLVNLLLNLDRNTLWRYLLASSIEDISCSLNSLRSLSWKVPKSLSTLPLA